MRYVQKTLQAWARGVSLYLDGGRGRGRLFVVGAERVFPLRFTLLVLRVRQHVATDGRRLTGEPRRSTSQRKRIANKYARCVCTSMVRKHEHRELKRRCRH